MERFTRHGGRLSAARLTYPSAPQPWIDLSTGVNPFAYPAPRASAQARARLPDPQEIAALEAAAASAFGVDDVRRVAAVPGSEAALRILPYLTEAKSVAIVGPTYSGHQAAWSRVPAAPVAALDQVDALTEAVVIVRPNNPDGQMTMRDAILAEMGRRRFVIVDEAFIETAPDDSLSPMAGAGAANGLIVLRSFGKFYGLAGLRLGFVIASANMATAVRSVFGDWPVSADAVTAGLAAYPDQLWAETARRRLETEAARLDDLLSRAGLEIVGGTSLFRLTRAQDAPDLFERLSTAGILVRPFSEDSHLLRFGIPGSQTAFDRLASALGVF